jgi:dTDP-4-amino-4,6-dideoxygalactose transaminase/acetyltransferase-like isoleucine patch superfamily enzyme
MSSQLKQSLENVKVGNNVMMYDFVNLYDCEIGDNSKIGTFVEIQKGAKIGKNVKVSSHTFICEGVTIEDDVFIGHNVSFINDKYPRATSNGSLQTNADWNCIPTLVKRGASIGTSATILCGVTIGENAIVGAGSVVTKDVPANTIVAGAAAQVLRRTDPAATLSPHPEEQQIVPFLDLKAQFHTIKSEILAALNTVLESANFILGDEVAAFEEEFAAYCGVNTGIAVNSGTSALHLSLLAAGISQGDEVITVPFTFVATAAAILYVGAKPVFVDIDPLSFTMDPTRLEAAITPRTKAIIPVHLYGQSADMDPILEIARRHHLIVIEDAAQAHGAEYKGQRVGGIGDLGCFSFYPGKNLGAYGEGGMVVTNNPAYAQAIRMLRDWGQDRKYHHAVLGFNYRMDALQGAVLRVKLRHLETWSDARCARAVLYRKLLANSGVQVPDVMPYARHVYHVYAVSTERREGLQQALHSRGIQTGIHYPIPVHLQPAYANLGYRAGDFPHSERAAQQVLSLPMYAELPTSAIHTVADTVHTFAVHNLRTDQCVTLQ